MHAKSKNKAHSYQAMLAPTPNNPYKWALAAMQQTKARCQKLFQGNY